MLEKVWLLVNQTLVPTTTVQLMVTSSPVKYTYDETSSCGCGYTDVLLPQSRIAGGSEAVPFS